MTDYCTLLPDGWWAHCCAAHDAGYAAQVGQAVADMTLMQCVASALPAVVGTHPALAPLVGAASVAVAGVMFVGVRLFGRRFYKKAKSPTTLP